MLTYVGRTILVFPNLNQEWPLFQAIVMYNRALAKLDKALEAYQSSGDDPATKKRRLKLVRVRQQIVFRLQEHKVPDRPPKS